MDDKAFGMLTDNIIKELVPVIGDRVIFTHHYNMYKEKHAKEKHAVSTN